MKYKGYIKLEHEVEAENEEQAKEKIADYWDDVLLAGFDSSSVELEPENKGEPSAFEGMTNGEVIQAVFGVMVLTVKDGKVWVEGIFFPFDEVWWNAPYKAESEGKAE